VDKGRAHWTYFKQLLKEGVGLDSVTFVGVFNACAIVVALGEGRHVHE
jgi:hypothetical protein